MNLLDFEQLQKRVPRSRNWFYQQMRAGRFPQRINFAGSLLWTEDQIEQWIAENVERQEGAK